MDYLNLVTADNRTLNMENGNSNGLPAIISTNYSTNDVGQD
uniref:Uncharacterized protein n=1 Tax=Panagrolaimus sp. JU765 TaxID=591449 RepID=A0AC34RGJ3_9BILA